MRFANLVSAIITACGLLPTLAQSVPTNGSWYGIVNAAKGTFVDLRDGNTQDGTTVFTWAIALNTDSQKNQVWQFLKQNDGSWKIRSANGISLINLENGSNALGTRIQGWKDDGRIGSAWFLEPVAWGALKTYYFRFKNKDSGTVIDLYGGRGDNGTPLWGQGDYNKDNLAQAWYLVPLKDSLGGPPV